MSAQNVATYGIGIDLGTTNTVACTVSLKDGSPTFIENNQGSRSTPSLIAFGETGFVVGNAALELSGPENTARHVKRFIGSGFDKIENIAKSLEFKIKKWFFIFHSF